MHCSPDPPNYSEEDFEQESASEIALDIEDSEDGSTEDSGDESISQTQFVYELLPQDIISGINSVNGHTIIDEYLDSVSQNHIVIPPCNSEEEAASPQTSNKERIDIEVNDDEVRAAMQNVTLPPSSIPSWAVSVPESQWTSFLLSRISVIRSNNKP